MLYFSLHLGLSFLNEISQDSVKISDVGQGTNPIRIVSIRGLPDQPGDKDYPREEWIDQKDSGDDAKNTSSDGEGASDDGKDGELTDQSGDYVNMEVSFVYQALPGQASQLRQSNIQLRDFVLCLDIYFVLTTFLIFR